MNNCQNTIEQNCKEEEVRSNKEVKDLFSLNERSAIQEQKQTEGSVMHCLLEIKTNNPRDLRESEPKCFRVLEHWQILTLKDWHFSPSFKKACSSDVRELCKQP